uniref:Uncharacterized protein n=1 Tax=Anguilla anguilla TaxID=7936 RepID=A0A0E9TD33_ANGAN
MMSMQSYLLICRSPKVYTKSRWGNAQPTVRTPS